MANLYEVDKQWLMSLGDSKWYHMVSSCLDLAKKIASMLCINKRSAMMFGERGRVGGVMVGRFCSRVMEKWECDVLCEGEGGKVVVWFFHPPLHTEPHHRLPTLPFT